MSSRSAGVAFALVGALGLFGGCSDNNYSLSNVGWVTPDLTQMSCIYTSSSPTFVERGVYDTALPQARNQPTGRYTAALEVRNNLLPINGQPIDTQHLIVKSFDVEVIPHGAISTIIPPSQFSYQVPTVDLAEGDAVVYTINAFDGVSSEKLANLRLQTTDPQSLTLRARPVYDHGEEQHEGAYASIPIDICWGCLSGGTEDGHYPPCTAYAGATPLIGNSCNNASDINITCCEDTVDNQGIICGMAVQAASMLK